MKNTCQNDIFICPKKKKNNFVYYKLYVHNTLWACPIRETVISWSFKMLARIWLLLAPGNRASAYVAPWHTFQDLGFLMESLSPKQCLCSLESSPSWQEIYAPLYQTMSICSIIQTQYQHVLHLYPPGCRPAQGYAGTRPPCGNQTGRRAPPPSCAAPWGRMDARMPVDAPAPHNRCSSRRRSASEQRTQHLSPHSWWRGVGEGRGTLLGGWQNLAALWNPCRPFWSSVFRPVMEDQNSKLHLISWHTEEL